jgi:DNA-binding response OmpR family regulator
MRIWLLEDDPAQAAMAKGWLEDAGYEVCHFDTGSGLVDSLENGRFDLLILDWELPDGSGIDVLKQVRDRVRWHVPILFVTQRDAESDIVAALEAGADDYMVKTISRAEFLARVTALGRRLANEQLEFSVGPYSFYPETRSVTRHDEAVDLTAKDYALAQYLFRNVGRLLSREQLLRDVWNVSGINTRTVDVHMSRIRKQLHISPESGFRIKTIYQHGYRLETL